jgi:hypothetical protein
MADGISYGDNEHVVDVEAALVPAPCTKKPLLSESFPISQRGTVAETVSAGIPLIFPLE